MNIQRLTICAHSGLTAGDSVADLRRLIMDLYRDEGHYGYRFVRIVSSTQLRGFDRLAVPLEYARILSEWTTNPIAMPRSGQVVTVVGPAHTTKQIDERIVSDLVQVTSATPTVQVKDLPARFNQIKQVLNDLS